MWKLRVPPKIKDLLWRAANNCVPTKTQLRSRHVNIDATCPMCKNQRETIPHCFVECSFARACWERTGIGVYNSVSGSFAGWLEEQLRVFEGSNRTEIAMVCWAIWKVRTDLVWNNIGPTVEKVRALAEGMGVREALSWIKENNWQNAIVETDNLTVVQSIRSTLPMLSYFGDIINECRDLLKVL